MGRGKLRIYLGAAPGVGKTYAMLSEAHRRVERGTDAVIAFVEHHNRPRTEVMLHGLELLPRHELEYRGSTFTEMDVDAVLERAPAVALVDELAHTNVPGSRNAKRWQDVEELLKAGIDVISTVNIQHLESLGDVVAYGPWEGAHALAASGLGWGAFRHGRVQALVCTGFLGRRYEDLIVTPLRDERLWRLTLACLIAHTADVGARGHRAILSCASHDRPGRLLAWNAGLHLEREFVEYGVGLPSGMRQNPA